MDDVACNESEGNHFPSSGNLFFLVMSTVMIPVTSSVVVCAETCERSAIADIASTGLSDVIAERAALRAISLNLKVSRHTDSVASSNTAHNTTNGAISANSTVA